MKQAKELSRIAGALEGLGNTPTVRNTSQVSARKQKLPLMARIILFAGSSDKRTWRARARRRSYAITAYVGPNGGGKSLAMICDTLPTQHGIRWHCDNKGHLHTAKGITSGWRMILSTVALLHVETGESHPLYIPFTDFSQLIEAEHCDVLMDEVTGVASSRESLRMDSRVANKLVQLRRCDVVLRWSAPNWARSDKVIREVTQAVVECRGYFPGAPLVDTEGSSSGGIWAPNRVFRFRAFDTAEFEEWSAGKRDKVEPVVSEWFRGAGSTAFKAYDTLDAVTAVAGMTPEDTCTVCEGRITRHLCKGHGPKLGTTKATPPEISPETEGEDVREPEQEILREPEQENVMDIAPQHARTPAFAGAL